MAPAINVTIEKRLKEIFGVTPKDCQSNSLAALIREQDVFQSTTTRGGKILCYQSFRSVCSDLQCIFEYICSHTQRSIVSSLYYRMTYLTPKAAIFVDNLGGFSNAYQTSPTVVSLNRRLLQKLLHKSNFPAKLFRYTAFLLWFYKKKTETKN